MLTFNLRDVPFSRAGAYQAFNFLEAPRWWAHRGTPHLVWRKLQVAGGTLATLSVLRKGKRIPFRELGSPERLLLRPLKGVGFIEISFVASTTVRFRGRGLSLQLETPPPGDYDLLQPDGDGRWRLNLSSCKAEMRFQAKAGMLEVDAPWDGVKCKWIKFLFSGADTGAEWEIIARETRWSLKSLPPVSVSWKQWHRATPKVPRSFARARDLASYVTWSAMVDLRATT